MALDNTNRAAPKASSEGLANQLPCSELTGYLHPLYADCLREFGEPIELPNCRGWLLAREIPGTPLRDAMGCYPLFACQDWRRLGEALQALEGSLVSVALVTDPFGNWEAQDVKACFDTAFHFKDHYFCDLAADPEQFVSKHHRRYARKALEHSRVDVVDDPASHLDEWVDLYHVLVRRHSLTGIKAFSRNSFEKQLAVPGLVMFRATLNGETLGMLLWFVQGDTAYYHLGAHSDVGYEMRASFGLFWKAIEYFSAQRLKCVNLGAGAGSGLQPKANDGLSAFKSGWSTGTRPVWFCGKILDREKYAALVEKKCISPGSYFPLYRKGEFA